MTDSATDDSFTKKHARLTRIATISNLFAWIVFIGNILLIGARVVEVQNSYNYQSIAFAQSPNFGEMLSKNPLFTASFAIDLLSILWQGIAYGLTLKGISLGLNMIVEIDLNYKDKLKGESNE